MVATPEVSLKFNFVFAFSSMLSINEIEVWKHEKGCSVFMFVEDRIESYRYEGPFEMFSQGKKNVIVVGHLNNLVERRMFLNTDKDQCRLYAIIQKGLLVVTVDSTSSANLKQDWIDIDTTNCAVLKRTEFGLFMGFPDRLIFFDNPSNIIELPIPNVVKIERIEDRIWLIQPGKMMTMMINEFRNFVFAKACSTNDDELALNAASSREERRHVLSRILRDKTLAESAKYLAGHQLGFNVISRLLDPKGSLTLLYLKEVLKRMSDKEGKLGTAIHLWIFAIHSMLYPEYKEDFVTFIRDHAMLLGRQIMTRLEQIGFTEGLAEAASVFNDHRFLVDVHYSSGDLDKMFECLEQVKDHDVFSRIMLKLLHSNQREVGKQYLVNMNTEKRVFRAPVLVKVLSEIPEIAENFINNNYWEVPGSLALLILSLCMNHNESRLIDILLESCVPSDLLLRNVRKYECKQAEARILLATSQPEKAVTVAYKSMGWHYTQDMLKNVINTDIKKRAFHKLLELESYEERLETMQFLEQTNLFDFGEVMDFIDDEMFLGALNDAVIEYTQTMEDSAKSRHYRQIFPRIYAQEFVIDSHERCSLCHRHIVGSLFIRYPCGHMCHSDCVLSLTGDRAQSCDRVPTVIESCPLCGFASIPYAMDAFEGLM